MPAPANDPFGDLRALENACARAVLERTTGTVMQAPQRIPAGAALTLSGYRVSTLRDAAQWPPTEAMSLLVASHLESARVWAAPAQAPATAAFLPPPPAPDPGEGFTGSSFRHDVSGRLGFSPQPGHLCVWLIVRGEASGPARVEVFDPASRPIDDPEVLRFLAGWRRKHPPRPRGADPTTVWPPEAVFGSYPSYRARSDGPPMPSMGIALQTASQVDCASPAAWVLSGAYRLTIPRRQLVLKPVSGYATTAVVPMTLVITAHHDTGPLVMHLKLPSETPVAATAERPVVEGRFALNLFSLRGMWREPGTYFIYAVCGDALSPPAVARLAAARALARAG